MPIYYSKPPYVCIFQAPARLPSKITDQLPKINKDLVIVDDEIYYSRNKEVLDKKLSKIKQINARNDYNSQIRHYLSQHKYEYNEHHSAESDYYYVNIDAFTIRIRVSNHIKCNREITYLEFKYGNPKSKQKIRDEVQTRMDAVIKKKPSSRIYYKFCIGEMKND